jgi:hypothetical protein
MHLTSYSVYTPYFSYVIIYLVKKYFLQETHVKNNGRKAWVLLLVLLAGVLIGGVLWLLLLQILPASMNKEFFSIGTDTPWTINLYLVELTFGIKLHINPGSAAGLIAGLAFYFWRR